MIRHWTLRQLRLFEAVARLRSYTRAAQELHLTQPAVSIQIKRLEDSIGLPLLQQVGKRLYLTRAGEEAYAAFGEVVARLQEFAGTVADIKGRVSGPLRIACVSSAKFFMPHFLGRFLREYPDVQPQLKVTNKERVIERLARNEDDFVVMGQVPQDLAVDSHPFLENTLVAIAYPEHPRARQRHIPLPEFAAERFLMREAGSGTRSTIERLLGEHGLQANIYMELGSSEAITQAVMAGLGVSVQSLSILTLELEIGRIAVLDVEGFPMRRMWYAVNLQGKRVGLTARTFLQFLLREGSTWPNASQP